MPSHRYHSKLPFRQYVGRVGTRLLHSIVCEPGPGYRPGTNLNAKIRVLCSLVGHVRLNCELFAGRFLSKESGRRPRLASRASGPPGTGARRFYRGRSAPPKRTLKAAQPPLSALRHREDKRLGENLRQPIRRCHRRQPGASPEPPSTVSPCCPLAMLRRGPDRARTLLPMG